MKKQLTIKAPDNINICYCMNSRTKKYNEWRDKTKDKINKSTVFGAPTNKNLSVEMIFNKNKGEQCDLLLKIKQILDVLVYSQVIVNDNQVKHLLIKRIDTKQNRNTCRFYLNKQLSKINKSFTCDSFNLNNFSLNHDCIKYAIDPYLTNNEILKGAKVADTNTITTPKNSKLTIVLNINGAYKANEQVLNSSMYNDVDIDAYVIQVSKLLDKPNNINEIEIFYTYSNHYSFFTIEALE